MTNDKDNNKAAAVNNLADELLGNVAGGKDDVKYAVGDAVVFKHLICISGVFVEKEKNGVITAINGTNYTIEVNGTSFDVEEEDILRPGIVQIENGAFGGW